MKHGQTVFICIAILLGIFYWCCLYYCFLLEKETAYQIIVYLGSCFVLLISYSEYLAKVARDKSATLDKYNQRYIKDKDINICITYLIDRLDGEKVVPPELRTRELFMRFYEELQMQIEGGALNKKQTYTLFGYYAGVVDQLGTHFVSDYYDDCWSTFRKFAISQRKIKNMSNKISRPVYQIGPQVKSGSSEFAKEGQMLDSRDKVFTSIYNYTECAELAFLQGPDFERIFGKKNADYGASLAVVKITNPKTGKTIRRLFRTCSDININPKTDFIALPYTSLLRLCNGTDSFKSMDTLVVERGNKWLYYWSHPFHATMVSVRLGVIGLIIGAIGTLVGIFSL